MTISYIAKKASRNIKWAFWVSAVFFFLGFCFARTAHAFGEKHDFCEGFERGTIVGEFYRQSCGIGGCWWIWDDFSHSEYQLIKIGDCEGYKITQKKCYSSIEEKTSEEYFVSKDDIIFYPEPYADLKKPIEERHKKMEAK